MEAAATTTTTWITDPLSSLNHYLFLSSNLFLFRLLLLLLLLPLYFETLFQRSRQLLRLLIFQTSDTITIITQDNWQSCSSLLPTPTATRA